MEFYAVLDQVVALLRSRGRVSYRALKRQFDLDDELLADLKAELRYAHYPIEGDDDQGLVWTGETAAPSEQTPPPSRPETEHAPHTERPSAEPRAPEAERRQLTVLFCDLVDSTVLASQLDPEEWREVVLAYQATCVEVLQRFDGYVAQYLGDGLLVYFGYPQAHEDDAQRAVRTGLGIVDAMGTLNTRLEQHKGVRLAVRIGIHTGLVVVGPMGSGGRHEPLALGETPNLAARLQSLAAPNTVAISDTTHRLVQGYFHCDDLGIYRLKGIETPMRVSRVMRASAAQNRLDVAGASGLTPLVGREHEVGLLRERWAQSHDGLGQVVLLSGEAGIGKSRLVRALTERVVEEGAPRLTLRCSPYHTNSAFYPIIEHLQRLLQWHRDESPAARLAMLEQALQTAGLLLEEGVPLLAALLTVPVPERYPPLTLSPQRQKQKTQEALVAWLLADAARQPVLVVWEDLHWADPSSLELLGRLLDQVPTARLLLVLTARPDFHPPWAPRSYATPFTLTRLTRPQIEEMVLRMTGGRPVPAEVLAQIVAKTDGIPLFVEELVKTILASGLVQEEADRYVLTGPLPPLAIPATLQDALMARLDRLAVVKEVAQLGAVLGREFSYKLLQAVSPWDEGTLQRGLHQLVAAEFLYQQGLPPQATYRFKHALIQDAAYQSLLRSTRQRHHQHIAQVVEARFPEICETQPELLAHHYTEAGLGTSAIRYWQQAGERALQRSAYLEAIGHLTRGLDLLATLPAPLEWAHQELDLQIALGSALVASRGNAAPEVGRAYARARALGHHVGETPPRFPVLWGLWVFHNARAEYRTASALGEQLLTLGHETHDAALLLAAHRALGATSFYLGEFARARSSLEQGIALYNRERHHALAALHGEDLGVACLSFAAWALGWLGYAKRARQRAHEALTLARELCHPVSLSRSLLSAAMLHQLWGEGHATQERAEAIIAVAIAQGFPAWAACETFLRGWALPAQGEGEQGIAQIREGLATWQAMGQGVARSYGLALLAEAYAYAGEAAEGLHVVAEALVTVSKTKEGFYEAAMHRLKGELLLKQALADEEQAEACFQQALAVARRQEAKSLELRAAMGLSRLWQRQGKQAEARTLLAGVYNWFNEGFDTADLQEAKALLEELS